MSLAGEYSVVHDGHVRLAALRLLDGQPTYSANDSILCQAVNAMGLSCTRDQMRGHLVWMEEQRLITRQEVLPTVVVATLTERGADVANGRSIVPGVQRPSPRG